MTAQPEDPTPIPAPAAPAGIGADLYTQDQNTRSLIVGAMKNARERNRAKRCQDIDEDVFLNKTLQFLSYWKPESALFEDYTPKDVLERLILYRTRTRTT